MYVICTFFGGLGLPVCEQAVYKTTVMFALHLQVCTRKLHDKHIAYKYVMQLAWHVDVCVLS